jgi:O-antigen ligase
MINRIPVQATTAHPIPAAARLRRPKSTAARRPSWLLICAMWVLILYPIIPLGFAYPELNLQRFSLGNGAASLLGSASAPVTMPTEGTPLSRAIWLALLVFGLVVIMMRPREALQLLRRTNPFLLLFLALSISSTLWSIEPTVTIRRFIRVLTVVSDGAAFALLAKSPRNFQSTLRPILTAFLLGSMLFALAYPELGTERINMTTLATAWHGLAPQKNVLGSLAATTFLLWLHGILSKESAWWKALTGMGISAVCLLESRSATALLAALLASGLLFLLLRSPASLKRSMPYLITIFAGIVLVYSLAVLNLIPGSFTLLSPIAALTGKDLTFSGRTEIWQIIYRNISFHPVLGGGYGAYWTGLPNSPSMEMLIRLYYYPTESHNGYLDVINDLGYVGFVCLLGYIAVYLAQGIKLFLTVRSQGVLYLTLFFDQLIGNLSEARWFNSLSTDFALMTIATMAMAKLLADGRRRREAPVEPATPFQRNKPRPRIRHQ